MTALDGVAMIPLGTQVRSCAQAWGDGQLSVSDFTVAPQAAMGLLGAFLDPVNWLVGNILGPIIDWILANLPPCKKVMDVVTGDLAAINAWGTGFQTASQSVAQTATTAVQQANSTLAQWQGQGAEAYRKAQKDAIDLQRDIADKLHSMYNAAYMIGGLVAAVKEIVVGLIKELVTDLVTKAVMAAAAAIPSLGSAIAAYMAWAAGKYALVMGKVARWLQKLFTKAAEATKKIAALSALFSKVAGMFGKMAGKYDTMLKGAQDAAKRAADAKRQAASSAEHQQKANQLADEATNRSGRRAAQGEQNRADQKHEKATSSVNDAHKTLKDTKPPTNPYVERGKKTAKSGYKGYDKYGDTYEQDTTNPADGIPDF